MNTSGLTVFQNLRKRTTLVVLAGNMVACGGARDAFTDGRVLDRCESAWPVCSKLAPCLLGPETYAEGRFPGSGSFLFQLPEASTVKVSFLFENVTAAGESTVLTFFEEGCRTRVRTEVTGKTAMSQMESEGAFTQSADLTGVGDHLVEFQSDLQGRYTLKLQISPGRRIDD